jgi:methionine synthase I (cobalamin-dependent)
VVAALEALGVGVIGVNCTQGPQPMLETVQRMAAAATSA